MISRLDVRSIVILKMTFTQLQYYGTSSRPVALYPVSAGENVLNSPLGSWSPSPFSRTCPP